MQAYWLSLHKQYLKQGKPTPLQSSMYNEVVRFIRSHLHADTLHCACQLRADQVWSLVHGQWRPGERGRTGGEEEDFTQTPADMVGREALQRDGFALFSCSVYEDLIHTWCGFFLACEKIGSTIHYISAVCSYCCCLFVFIFISF